MSKRARAQSDADTLASKQARVGAVGEAVGSSRPRSSDAEHGRATGYYEIPYHFIGRLVREAVRRRLTMRVTLVGTS